MTCLTAALRESPENGFLSGSMGEALLEAGRYEESLQYFDNAIRRLPRHAVFYHDRGSFTSVA